MCLLLLGEDESAKLKSAVFFQPFQMLLRNSSKCPKLALIISHLGSWSECEQTSPTVGFTKKKKGMHNVEVALATI